MKQISDAEAELLLRRSAKLSQASSELEVKPNRFPGILVGMVPSLLMLPFGDSLSRSLGISSQGALTVLGLIACVFTLAYETYILQRRVAALTELVRAMQRSAP